LVGGDNPVKAVDTKYPEILIFQKGDKPGTPPIRVLRGDACSLNITYRIVTDDGVIKDVIKSVHIDYNNLIEITVDCTNIRILNSEPELTKYIW